MCSNDFKYPIKYIAMPIVTEENIAMRIVIKCYLLEETKRYDQNGEITFAYKIVPFYDHNLNKVKIEFIGDKCSNYTVVPRIFDTASEARAYSRVYNQSTVITTPTTNEIMSKYYNIEYKLLNEEQKNNIINFCDLKRTRKKM